MGTLTNVTTLLNSKLVRERHEGIAQLRSALATDHAADKLKSNDWIVLFTALFEAFLKEKQACRDKGLLHTTPTGAGAALIRRLTEVASAVRFLVEKGVKAFNTTLRKQVLDHVVTNIKHQGRLIDSIALDYVKSMKALLSYTPHLDHLGDRDWITLVQLSFNVILEDPFRKELDLEPEDDPPAEPSDEEVAEPSTSVASPRKRRRVESSRATASPAPSTSRSLPVSLEKIEFASLLSMLLRAPNAPIVSQKHPFLAANILNRLERFLVQYPADTSLHHDYLTALSATLSQVALNEQARTIKFAKATWPALVGIWSAKNQRLKEDLVVILRTLFPYFTSALDEGDCDDGLLKLWRLLGGEAQSRWGVDSLSMDSLRFEIAENEHDPTPSAFVAKTFRYGWHFESSQALAWAILELHADCGEKLYRLSESVHAIGGQTGKRRKMSSPVDGLLNSIRTPSSAAERTFSFQALLFFIDRHWSIVHATLQQQVIRTLTHCLSDDDPSTQSWSFICLAAVTHLEGSGLQTTAERGESRDNHWDTVWTFAMRRANVPAVCRAACHTARVLLRHGKALLSSQRMLAEIETLAKDLDVQGPSAPCDSVCEFLVLCMRIANQDVSLYRIHLEDKVLAWLVDNWRPSGFARRLPQYSAQDILGLLGVICSFSQQADLVCEILLPDCAVVVGMKENAATAVIRDFSLHAKLPAFHKPLESHTARKVISLEAIDSCDVIPPGPRERKISSFFLKYLDAVAQDWDSQKDVTTLPPAEKVRSVLDLSIMALFYESMLRVNGTQSNRRVEQAACRAITYTLPSLSDQRWTLAELILILDSFSPLHHVKSRKDTEKCWEALLPPGRMSGIRTEVLRTLTTIEPTPREQREEFRRILQRSLFRSSDIQDVSMSVIKVARSILQVIVDKVFPSRDRTLASENTRDGFAGLQISTESTPFDRSASGSPILRTLMDTCFAVVATFPALHSSPGEPTRDRELMQWFEDVVCQEDNHVAFFAVLPSLILPVGTRTLRLSTSSLTSIFEWLGTLIRTYNYRKNNGIKSLTAQLLQSTMHIWLDSAATYGEADNHAPLLLKWLVDVYIQEAGALGWLTRDSILVLLDEYIEREPTLSAYKELVDDDDELPHMVLPRFINDDDIRVRFRAAPANARLLYHASALDARPMNLYGLIHRSLSFDDLNFGLMLTRFLTLANLMVVSSAVRRGPYWHLLEISLVTARYNLHLTTTLRGVADRLGMRSLSALFDVYGSQIANSVFKAGKDFSVFPPHLLGFRSRSECTERTFSICTPIYLVAHDSHESFLRGRQQFLNHCRTLQKDVDQGLLECLPEIIGFHMVYWLKGNSGTRPKDYPNATALWKPVVQELYDVGTFDRHLRECADGVVTTILCTLQDNDFSQDGSIVTALNAQSSSAAEVFQHLSSHRVGKLGDYEEGTPGFPTDAVLQALDWLNHVVPHVEDTAVTYHVLHRLFAALSDAPLLNDQVRLVNSLCLWIACRDDHFGDITLLQTLLNGTMNLVNQVDMARDAQSILNWVFTTFAGKLQDIRLAEVLLRVACAAYEYSLNPTEDIMTLGAELLNWIEDVTYVLAKRRGLQSTIRRALLAWPRDCPKKLEPLVREPSLRDLQTILSDERISSNKFRMVRQIYALAEAGNYDEDAFSKHDFWKLRQVIPSGDSLLGDELQAFISLLVRQRGQIDGLNREMITSQTAHLRYLQQKKKEPQVEQGLLARKAIISSLCALLDDSSTSQVHLAFQTLRALVAATLADLAGSNGWPAENLAELQLLRAYSRPFSTRPIPNLAQLLEEDNSTRLSENYSHWITFFSTALGDFLGGQDPFYGPLALILQKDARFAEEVLPILVHTYLYADTSRMDDSHTPARDVISKYFSKLLGFNAASKACRKAIVDIVLHLREWTPPDFRDPLAYDKWLTIDFVVLSQSAVSYGAYTTALLFLELAAEYAKDKSIAAEVKEVILYQIYSHVDEPDGFYAIPTQDVHSLLMKRLHHENQWDKAFQFHGAALETRKPDSAGANGVLQAFRAFGFDSLAMTTLQTLPGAETLVDREMTYELGWRAGVWDLPLVSSGDDTAGSLYLALRAVYRERDLQAAESTVLAQLRQQMGHLRRLGYENLVEIRQVSQTLMCLDEIRRWCQPDTQVDLHSDVATINDLYFSNIPGSVEFSDLESILATRISLLRSAREREERLQIGDMATPIAERLKGYETSCLLQLSQAARAVGNSQIAINSVVKAQKLNGKEDFDVACEFANVLWLTKEPQMANEFLKELLAVSYQVPRKSTSTSHAALLALKGNWASQACLEKPDDIKSHYFDVAIQAMHKETSREKSSIYHEYATFSERQYHAIVKSPDVLRLKVYIDRKTAEIKQRESQINQLSQVRTQANSFKERDLAHQKKKAEKLLKIDQGLYAVYLKSRDTFLRQAIQMYSQSLASSDAFDDDAAIRLCSLWFSNFDNIDGDLPATIGAALGLIPSHKFVFLAHQLSARLSDTSTPKDESSNHGNLRRVVIRMCREHPFHALFPVYCLQSDTNSNNNNRSSRQSLGSQSSMSQIVRAGAASSILARLRSDPACATRVTDVENVCKASLQWAKYAIKPKVGKNSQVKHQQIDKTLLISRLANVRVPVVTKYTPLDPTGRYEDCVWITRYDPMYETAGGINLPKICYCIGSDGRRYKQLFKGEGGDDLRQDAVMEQVFDLVNILLRKDRESTRRNLRIRGYKVIPLAAQAGVIEFVENTTTLHSWLPSAHKRYRPDDISHGQFHMEMSKLRDSFGQPENVDAEKMTELFVNLRKRFHPVMRHYFTELTKNPSEWFRMRLYYARSVATTSIVGHMIGLGDRHCSNILLDKENGEVVHIDLGIAFEQGKLLPVVERVPFRLTADMVDGLGSTGTQGVFQRCAEHTLRVLRDRSDVILTVLEVFKYDPLHSWTASDLKLQGVQSVVARDRGEEPSTRDGADEALNHIVGFNVSTATGTDEAADRALSAVARKLDKTLSVEFTVNELIAEATDVVNLGNMWHGWAPYY